MPDEKSALITSRRPLVDFAREGALPVNMLYVGEDDELYLRSSSDLPNTVYNVRGDLLLASGEISPFHFSFTPAADRSFNLRRERLAEGYLIHIGAFPSGTTPIRGQCWIEVGILRGLAVAAGVVRPLFADYLVGNQALGWPPGRVVASAEGPGFPEVRSGGDPAAGAEISFAMPGNTRVRFVAVQFRLVTDATAANRTPVLEIRSSANVIWRSRRHAAQTASQTRDYFYAVGIEYQNAVDTESFHNSLPELNPHPGLSLVTVTDALQAGDNYGAPLATLERWLED